MPPPGVRRFKLLWVHRRAPELKRLLILIEVSAVTDSYRTALYPSQVMDVAEVFVLFPSFSRNPLRRVRPAARFWRHAHACLDVVLRELSEMGLIADGIVTQAPCRHAVSLLLSTWRPSHIVIVTRRYSRRYRRRLEGALRVHAGNVSLRPLSISWSST